MEQEGLTWTDNLCLEIKTRWNPTILMIYIVTKYIKSFKFLEKYKSNYSYVFELRNCT